MICLHILQTYTISWKSRDTFIGLYKSIYYNVNLYEIWYIYFDFFERSFVFSDVSESLFEWDRFRWALGEICLDDESLRVASSDDGLVLLILVWTLKYQRLIERKKNKINLPMCLYLMLLMNVVVRLFEYVIVILCKNYYSHLLRPYKREKNNIKG